MCYDDDGPEVELANEFRKARKPHRCYACREEIPAGHRYHVVVQIYDGDVTEFKHCARCWALAMEIMHMNGYVQWDLNCGISWREAAGEDPPESVARLAFMTPDEAQALAAREVR